MRPRLLAALLALSASLGAWGGTPESWLGGTRPWDTMGYCEADLEAHGAGGDGLSAYGLGSQIGVLNWLQAGVQGRWMVDGPDAPLDLSVQVREPYFRGGSIHDPGWSWLLPPAALYGRWHWDGERWTGHGGLILVLFPFEEVDSSYQLNIETGPDGTVDLRAGYWTPYWVYAVRGGLELIRSDAASAQGQGYLLPQILLNAPGDLSLSLGVRFGINGDAPTRYLARLSWILFPDP